ncbi:MAG: hypothetical protein IPF82_16855 [Blastocatellia bacterium]|nr:hypothetical protein [Blastocatellia bacterium]
MTAFPFLTTFDPPGSSEGTLDPLGLYQIANQLAVQLVPAVRERMQRIRFLTAMAVGAFVTEGLDDDPQHRDASPYLVWEWMVVETFVRSMADDPTIRGIPGILKSRRAIQEYGYLDARSYLKTPRIFGFHGVYKRLAVHLGIVDVHLGRGPNAAGLVDAWARDRGLDDIDGAKSLFSSWRETLRRGLAEKPPRTKPAWTNQAWADLAQAFAPANAGTREKRYLRQLLLATADRPLGALPSIWKLREEFPDDAYSEEAIHNRLEHVAPSYGPLIRGIRAYEAFARSLRDAFDVLKTAAAGPDARGFSVTEIASNEEFVVSVRGLSDRFDSARQLLSGIDTTGLLLRNLFDERFAVFEQPLEAGECALALCAHHESVQQRKSADGKRPWFDRIGPQRIYIRHAYREDPRDIQPGRYVHTYRGWPIQQFYSDLT